MIFLKKALQKDYKQKNNLKEQIFISIQTDIGAFMSRFSNRISPRWQTCVKGSSVGTLTEHFKNTNAVLAYVC